MTSFLPENLSGLKNIIFGPGFGTHWVKGIVNEKKYHTLFMQPLKNLEIIKTLRERQTDRQTDRGRERERVFFVCCIMIYLLINNLLIIGTGK